MPKTENLFPAKAEAFYGESLKILNQSKIPFLVAGTVAVSVYTGMKRPTKDLDIFCKTGDYTKILQVFKEAGYKTEVTDVRWLAKVWQGKSFFDLVFNSGNAIMPITDQWFKESQSADIFGIKVRVLPPTELIYSKAFVMARLKFDGPDIAHLILRRNKDVNWKRLLSYLDPYWEVLLIHLLHFRFIYPSEREAVPKWLLKELLERLERQADTPTSQNKVCRGRLFSREDYEMDISEWGFADIIS